MWACEEGTAIEGRVQSVAVEDWFRFRPVFSDLVHGFGPVDGLRGLRFDDRRGWIADIPRFCDVAVVGGAVKVGAIVDWIGFGVLFSDLVHDLVDSGCGASNG